jgi:hypothetical protein
MVLLLFSPAAFGQSPFDGTWRFFPPLPKKPAVYLLTQGVLHCSGCIANIEIKADGDDHKVAETAYWDTVNVQAVNESTVEIIAKKAGKIMFTEVDAISPDGRTLTQLVKDTTEVETVTMETRNRRRADRLSRHFRFLASLQNQSIQKRFDQQIQMHRERIQCGDPSRRKVQREVRW